MRPTRQLHIVRDEDEGLQARTTRPVDNPPNPFASSEAHYLEGMEAAARVVVHHDHTRRILSSNDSPDIPFSYSVNPYRGCQHACAYCYARPTHEYLGLGAGTDFDTQIVVKPDAPQLLREAFDKPSWRGDTVVFSGVTDCYQPLEASYRLTRGCLEVCVDYKNPVGIITKSPLIERDLDGRLAPVPLENAVVLGRGLAGEHEQLAPRHRRPIDAVCPPRPRRPSASVMLFSARTPIWFLRETTRHHASPT